MVYIPCGIITISFCNVKIFFASSVTLISLQDLLMMMGEFDRCIMSSPATSQRFSMRFRSELCGGQSIGHLGICLCLDMPIREEKLHWWNKMVVRYNQVVSWPYDVAESNTEPRPDQLQYSRHEAWWVYHFIPLCSYPDAPIFLEQSKSGFIKPRDLLPLLQTSTFMLPSKVSDYPHKWFFLKATTDV